MAAFRQLICHAKKKRSSRNTIFNSTDNQQANRPKGIISDCTLYSGTKKFQFVAYARYSKVRREMPAVHSEWRIKGASLIRAKTEIRSLYDFGEFDIEKTITQLEFRSLGQLSINHIKHGLFLFGIETKRQKRLHAYIMDEARKKSMRFCHVHNLYTAIDFENFYRDLVNSSNLRARLQCRAGHRYPVTSLTKYRLSTFFIKV